VAPASRGKQINSFEILIFAIDCLAKHWLEQIGLRIFVV
jgi:hypothetical protein